MSDAPAAPVTENGVPPAAQEKVEETPGFKVRASVSLTWHKTSHTNPPFRHRFLPVTLRTLPRMKG